MFTTGLSSYTSTARGKLALELGGPNAITVDALAASLALCAVIGNVTYSSPLEMQRRVS